jgi:hypothetical protein
MAQRSNGRRTYGSRHINLKKRLLAELQCRPGQPCARCGWPMWPGQNLHLDHDDNSDGYNGLAHAACNLRAGQQLTTLILRARNWQPSPRSQRAIARKQARQAATEPSEWRTSRRW